MKTRTGINFTHFLSIAEGSNLNIDEWSNILHLSKRTMQRYKKETLSFKLFQSEIILQVVLIFQKGHDVFGSEINLTIGLTQITYHSEDQNLKTYWRTHSE